MLFDNEKNALNPGFCKGQATFSHLSCWGNFGRFSQQGHLDLLHTAPWDSSTYLYMVEQDLYSLNYKYYWLQIDT